ncbi:DUF3090 domain-containing protein [Demetria terragena]|uniref:DUF3090 domain-containing protein n=1 Tax=Demetria terragena TaxID=63959 RepID=UPI00036C22AF|nr:DUF3090 domain-containing protein [Demetria terragena]
MPLIEYVRPERFVAGTVGPPGQRTFFLQAVDGRRVTSVSLEKQQVEALAERISELLEDMPIPGTQLSAPEDNAPLSTPIEDEFRVSTLSLSWNEDGQVVVVEAYDAQVEIEPDETGDGMVEITPAGTSILKVALGIGGAREFVRRALATVAQGRPPCPFCGGPLDDSGHVCPRANGFKR